MADATLKEIGAVALTLILLLSLGYYVSLEDTHFCKELELGKKCDRLSTTGKTCYPTENTRIGSKYCSSGWEEIIKRPVYKSYTERVDIKQELCPVGAPCYSI